MSENLSFIKTSNKIIYPYITFPTYLSYVQLVNGFQVVFPSNSTALPHRPAASPKQKSPLDHSHAAVHNHPPDTPTAAKQTVP